MTYLCCNCGEPFDDPFLFRDATGETHMVSSCCWSSFDRAEICERCGRPFPWPPETPRKKLCAACTRRAVERLRYLLNNEFTEAEREALNEAFDGVPLTEPEKARADR